MITQETLTQNGGIKSGHLADFCEGSFNGNEDRFVTRQMAILTEDMGPFINYYLDDIFGNNLAAEKKEQVLQIARESLAAYKGIFRQAFPGRDWTIREEDINTVYENQIQKALEETPEAVIIINDRYVAQHLDEQFPNNIFRFSSTRILKGTNTGAEKSETMPRPGDPSFEEQLDAIETKLNTTGRSLNGSIVIFADDVTVKGSTENTVAQLFEERGATIDKEKSIYIYKVHIGNEDDDRPQSAGRSLERQASAEQREFTPLGGPIRQIGKNVALQQPAQWPWGNGDILRTSGFIQQSHLSKQQLELFLKVFGRIENVLKGTKRKDGTTFDYFSFKDFRWLIPIFGRLETRPPQVNSLTTENSAINLFGPSTMIRQYFKDQNKSPSLAHLNMLDYIQLALKEAEKDPKPQISHVVVDIDGSQLQLKYEDPTKKTFNDSILGSQVVSKLADLVGEFTGNVEDAEALLEKYDWGKSLGLLLENPGFAQFLEEKYGEETLKRLEERFISFYGQKRGQLEHKQYLEQYSFLPLAYHVLREFTWGQVQFDEVFKPNDRKAQSFSHTVVEQGGTMVFLSSSPRIHAMRVLEITEQKDIILSGKAVLITTEDLYHQHTLEKANKQTAFEALKMQTDDSALRSLQSTQNEKDFPVYLALKARLKHLKKAPVNRILCIGDQLFSDVRPAIAAGGYGYLANGPKDLQKIFLYANIQTENISRAPITHVFADLDGTVRKMRFPPGYRKRSMPYSVLGEQVKSGFLYLVDQYLNTLTEEKKNGLKSSVDAERTVESIIRHPGFAQFLEEKYGEETLKRLEERFISFYGQKRGQLEHKQYLEQYSFLPLAYHVLREFTWGNLDLDAAFEPDNGLAQKFSERIIQYGRKLIFLSAAPRIHAMDMLQAAGLQDLILSGQAELHTVEDLYDNKLNELSKEIIYKRYIEQGVDPARMLSVGDQPHSDAYPIVNIGGHAAIVDGPAEFRNALKRTVVFEYNQ